MEPFIKPFIINYSKIKVKEVFSIDRELICRYLSGGPGFDKFIVKKKTENPYKYIEERINNLKKIKGETISPDLLIKENALNTPYGLVFEPASAKDAELYKDPENVKRAFISLLSEKPPHRCGIGTFTYEPV